MSNINEITQVKQAKHLYLCLNCLFEFYAGITGATFVLFLYSKNLNTMETNVIVATSLIIAFFMEIPTGALADYLGYVKTTILMGILLCSTNLVFLICDTIPAFLIAQICLGISCAFESGTLDAWIIENTSEKESEHIFVTKNKFISIMMLVAGFLGGVIADIFIEGIFLFALIAAMLFVVLSILLMPKLTSQINKHHTYNVKENINGIKKIINDSITYCIKNKKVRNVILFNSLLAFAFSPVFVFWSPVLHGFENINYTIIGATWIFMRGFMLLGNIFLEKVKDRSFLFLAIVCIACGVCVVTLAFLRTFWSLFVGILAFEFILGMIYPLKETVLNVSIQSNNRATILSFNSMISCLLNYLSMIIMGKVATEFSIQITWISSGIIILIVSVIVLLPKIIGENSFK